MVMMFAAFTSAFVVKKADVNNWLEVGLPSLFWVSSVVIVASSVTMHLTLRGFKTNKLGQYKTMMMATTILGVAFMVTQIFAWKEMLFDGVRLDGNASGSFLYVISGVHLVHAFAGVVALIAFFVIAQTKYKRKEDIERANQEKRVGVELLATYWHFVDVLWIYLFVFFLLN